MSDLKPCPFCGGEAKVERSLRSFTPELWETYDYAKCKKCGARVEGADEAEAIEAWNARYERTCEVTYGEHGCPYCGECGFVLYSTSGYCPNCGTRIKEDADE